MKQCNCELCSHSVDRVGFKKFRKWNAKYTSGLQKELKKLKDRGIKEGSFCSDNEDEIYFAALKDNLVWANSIYQDLRICKKLKGKSK